MALYEYAYVDEDGVYHTVEQWFPMGKAPETVTVTVGDAVYTATRVITPPNLDRYKLSEWAVDLPPLKSPIIEGKND